MSLRPQPTMMDKLKAVAKLSSAALSATSAFLDYEVRTESITFTAYVKRAYIRSLLCSCSPLQLQWLCDSSSKTYKKWIATHRNHQHIEFKTDVLGEDGAKLHWIGRGDAEKVILYFHGGGFVVPLNKDHLSFMDTLRLQLKHEVNVDVRVAFLEYTLIPVGRYPTQLQQASRALRYLLNLGISPSNILIAGDSAGGLLVFQLLSHLLHPHPSIDPISMPTPPSGPFAGVLVISPWISFDNYTYQDDGVDFIPTETIRSWASLMIEQNTIKFGDSKSGKRRSDGSRPLLEPKTNVEGYWLQPNYAPEEWWRDTYKYASHILLTYGTKEAMSGDIEQFGEQLDRAFRGTKVGVKVVSETDGVHSGPLLATLLARSEDPFMETILEWVIDRFVKD